MVDVVFESQNAMEVMIQNYVLIVLQSMDSSGEYTYFPLTFVTDYESLAFREISIELAKSLNSWEQIPEGVKNNTYFLNNNEASGKRVNTLLENIMMENSVNR